MMGGGTTDFSFVVKKHEKTMLSFFLCVFCVFFGCFSLTHFSRPDSQTARQGHWKDHIFDETAA